MTNHTSDHICEWNVQEAITWHTLESFHILQSFWHHWTHPNPHTTIGYTAAWLIFKYIEIYILMQNEPNIMNDRTLPLLLQLSIRTDFAPFSTPWMKQSQSSKVPWVDRSTKSTTLPSLAPKRFQYPTTWYVRLRSHHTLFKRIIIKF